MRLLGVEPQSETVWRQADKYRVPRMCFVNKMDRTGADFYRCLKMIKERLGATTAVVNLPVGSESAYDGVIDLLTMKHIKWSSEDLGAAFDYLEIPADMKEEAQNYRHELIESVIEFDDAAMEAYLEGKEPSVETIKACIRKGTVSGKIVPVINGSAFKNKGVQPLLDAVVDFLPSPIDIGSVSGHKYQGEGEDSRPASDSAPLSMLAFKIMNDPFVGSLTFCRIYSGTLSGGSSVLNTIKEEKERVGRMLLMHANNREDIKEAYAGDIIAIAGLKNTTTGDSLCDMQKPIVLERMIFPDPVIDIAVEPKSKADQEKMGMALSRLAAEDPSLRVRTDFESGQTILSGMGELHLEIIVDRMKREFKVEANVGAPQVAYRETITKQTRIDYTHKKQSGGAGQFARVIFEFYPGERGSGYLFESKIVGGSVPREYIPGVEKGLLGQQTTGVLAGFPVVDFRVELVDGAYHDVDSSALAFEIAARAAFREAMRQGQAKLLEPIMKVEVVTPEEYMGDIIGDLNSRRGQVSNMDSRGNARVIEASVPLSAMFGYVNNLRSMSQGRAQYTMIFSHYEQVPQHVADDVISKFNK